MYHEFYMAWYRYAYLSRVTNRKWNRNFMFISKLRPRQNGWLLTDDISKWFYCMEIAVFWFKCHSNMFPMAELAIASSFELMVWLTHWGRVTHICVSKLTIIGSDDGLPPGRRQAIIWTNDGILLSGRSGTNFSEMLITIQTLSFTKMHLDMSSWKWRPFCLGLNVLTGA